MSAAPTPHELLFVVHGVPAPQGSKTKTRWGGMRDDNAEKLRPWRDRVAYKARAQAVLTGWERPGREGAYSLVSEFRFLRPESATVRRRPRHTVKPDLDKLIRAIGDALTDAGVIWDDSQLWQHLSSKAYVTEPADVGVHLRLVRTDGQART